MQLEKSVRRLREKFHGLVEIDKAVLLMRRYGNNHRMVAMCVALMADSDRGKVQTFSLKNHASCIRPYIHSTIYAISSYYIYLCVFLVCVYFTPSLFDVFLYVELDEEDKSALNNDPVAKVGAHDIRHIMEIYGKSLYR